MTTPLIRSVAHGLVALALATGFLAGCGGSSTDGNTPTPSGSTGPRVTKANFDKVTDGMTEKEVIVLLGPPAVNVDLDPKKAKDLVKGVQFPDLQVPGAPGVPAIKLTVMNWEEGDTLYEVVLQERKVVGKASASKKAKATAENAAKIKVGMPRAEVESILGKGTVQTGAKISNYSGDVTVWEGADGTITVGFADDKVAVTGGWQKK